MRSLQSPFYKIGAGLTRVHGKLIKLNKGLIVLLFLTGNLINSIFFACIAGLVFNEKLNSGFKIEYSGYEKLCLFVIAAPMLETLLFQFAIIETLRKKNGPVLTCICSALLFGISHSYTTLYVLYAFIAGLLFGWLYYLGKTALKGFLMVLTVHFLYNALIFCLMLI